MATLPLSSTVAAAYKIGTPGQPWGDAERAAWRAQTVVQRSYAEEVVTKLDALKSGEALEVVEYGKLAYESDVPPLSLFAAKSRAWDPARPAVLVTGGVHGYETSGVQGALRFLSTAGAGYAAKVNLVVAPCISPWGYERIQRWNAEAVDPNRSFRRVGDASVAAGAGSEAETRESKAIMDFLGSLAPAPSWLVHIDLHETTDSDETEFRPAKAARNGITIEPDTIPDGFYLVGDSENPQDDFQAAVIAAVKEVTHIAPADAAGKIIGEKITQEGVINYPVREYGLCAGLTAAKYKTTTEVYPDSPKSDADNCNAAQVAAVCAAIDFALAAESKGEL